MWLLIFSEQTLAIAPNDRPDAILIASGSEVGLMIGQDVCTAETIPEAIQRGHRGADRNCSAR
jgi:hypothetical protein